MPTTDTTFDVRRPATATSVIDVTGDVTPDCEAALMDAYAQASAEDARAVVLNFSGLAYMNSGGIGLLVTLLVRAQRARQQLLAFGLSDHYRQILALTRLDEAIAVHDDEAAALSAAG